MYLQSRRPTSTTRTDTLFPYTTHFGSRTHPSRQRPLPRRLDDAPLRPLRNRRPRDPDGTRDARLYGRARGPRRTSLAEPPRPHPRDRPRAAPGDRRRARLCERTPMTRLDNSRVVKAPTGHQLNATSGPTAAPPRMLMNNLHPDVDERPEELVVYGGT